MPFDSIFSDSFASIKFSKHPVLICLGCTLANYEQTNLKIVGFKGTLNQFSIIGNDLNSFELSIYIGS